MAEVTAERSIREPMSASALAGTREISTPWSTRAATRVPIEGMAATRRPASAASTRKASMRVKSPRDRAVADRGTMPTAIPSVVPATVQPARASPVPRSALICGSSPWVSYMTRKTANPARNTAPSSRR